MLHDCAKARDVPRMRLSALALVALAACGTNASIDGTVNGATVTAHDAMALTSALTSVTTVIVTTQANACQALSPALRLRNAQSFAFAFLNISGTSPNITTAAATQEGIYTVVDANAGAANLPPGNAVVVTYSAIDASCNDSAASVTQVTGGTVTLSRFDTTASGRVTGTFALTVKSGQQLVEQVSGHFDAAPCAVAADAGGDAGC